MLDSRQVQAVRSCLSPQSSGYRITTLIHTGCKNLEVQGEVQGISFIVSTNLAVLLHRKPSSAGRSHDSFRALGTTKETLRTLCWQTPKINFGDTHCTKFIRNSFCCSLYDTRGRAISLPRYATISYTY